MGLISALWPLCNESFFNFFFGFSVALYVVILFTSTKLTVLTGPVKPFAALPAPPKDQPQKKLYLNVFFLDRKEFIRNIIRSKVSRNRPVIRALAKRAAVALLENGIVEKVGQGLCQTIPEKLSPMGVTSSCTIAYTQKAFICFEVNLYTLNLETMLASGAGAEKAKKIVGALERFSIPAVNDYISKFFLGMIADKLITSLPTLVREKMYNKTGAELEVIVCSEAEQGPFLVQTIHCVQSAEAVPKAPSLVADSPPQTPSSASPAPPTHSPVPATPAGLVPSPQGGVTSQR